MTLDEAIDHCLERANQDCSSCADEHLQLAEWLIELKNLHKMHKLWITTHKKCALIVAVAKVQQPLMEVEMEKLKPCPVCGNHDLSFITSVVVSKTCVLCKECGEESNWYKTKNEAVKDWNRRAVDEVN